MTQRLSFGRSSSVKQLHTAETELALTTAENALRQNVQIMISPDNLDETLPMTDRTHPYIMLTIYVWYDSHILMTL
jgi:hypothetical protein